MEKKYVRFNGLRLAYLELRPDFEETIFFIHGNSSSSRLWRKQLSSDLFAGYRLVAIDLPAHGDSDPCRDPVKEYSPLATGKLIAEAIKTIGGISRGVFVGFSYGTNLIAEMLLHGIKPVGIVLIGSCIAGGNIGAEKILLDPGSNIFFHGNVDPGTGKAFFKEHLSGNDDVDVDTYLNDFNNVNPIFRTSMIQAALAGQYSDEIAELKKLDVPILAVFGEKDKLVNIDYLDDVPLPWWKEKIFKMKGAGHFVQTDQPEILNALLLEYCKARFAK